MSNETTLVGNILAVNVNKTTPILLKEYTSDKILPWVDSIVHKIFYYLTYFSFSSSLLNVK